MATQTWPTFDVAGYYLKTPDQPGAADEPWEYRAVLPPRPYHQPRRFEVPGFAWLLGCVWLVASCLVGSGVIAGTILKWLVGE